ncbi:MAG: agmatine deiminase family protein [Bacteroidales bacterium]|nr:agmatine deiminase family protein [Bacteroidales bacterium]
MKKTFILIAICALTLAVNAQSMTPTEEMMRQFRTTMQKRDFSQHRYANIPLSDQVTPQTKSTKSMPDGRVWFPGEWEEVQAIAVTVNYDHIPATAQGSGYWIADPVLTGYAYYYKYSSGNWNHIGGGPYKSTVDTTSSFGNVFFYLIDAIQMGGAEAWVRIERIEDSSVVVRKLQRMGLRHNNIRYIVGPGNSIWYRDCGPICFYYGNDDNVGMLDFTYYPGRALDDSLPTLISQQYGLPNYITRIEWEGGNCLVDGAGMVFSSDAIYENNTDNTGQLIWDGQNPSTIRYSQISPMTRAQVKQGLHDLLGQRATHILPAYRYDGGTGHVDLYADAWDENGFVFSIMPDIYSSWVDYQTGQKNIDSLCSYLTIHDRNYYMMGDIPFPGNDNGGNFTSQRQYNNSYTRTYSNHTFVNNVIMQPCFSDVVNGIPAADWDRNNIEALKSAYPGYTIYPVDVRGFDGSGGAIHCITKQIPAENPVRILHKNLHGVVAIDTMSAIPVSAVITNKSGIAHAEVMWREAGNTDWSTINLTANGNRFNGSMPCISDTLQHDIEYYISATSVNGKTITKPMTATQGGYYTFSYTNGGIVDSSNFDFTTAPMPAEDITFVFGENWVVEDTTAVREIHDIVGINTMDLEEQFGQFYPNPANANANIRINLGDGAKMAVSIVDITGRTVHSTELMSAGNIVFTIDASRLAQGIYHVVFQSKEQRIVRRLVVK